MSRRSRLLILPHLCTILLSAQTISCPALSNDNGVTADANDLKTVTSEGPISRRLPRPDLARPLPAGPQPGTAKEPLIGSVSTAAEGASVGALSGNLPVTQPAQKTSSPPALIYRQPVEETPALNGSASTDSVKLRSLETPPPTASVLIKPFWRNQVMEMRLELPDIHFWTSGDGTPQLDYRVWSNGTAVKISNHVPDSVDTYGGAINHGCWRGFSVTGGGNPWVGFVNYGNITNTGQEASPQIIAVERQAINYDDALAAAGRSGVRNIELSGSGIFWGQQSDRMTRRLSLCDRTVTHDPVKNQSYLKGPVRLTADYIRFDGPVSRIGTDVTLNARRIVVDGVDLPPGAWRQALTKIVQSAAQPSQP